MSSCENTAGVRLTQISPAIGSALTSSAFPLRPLTNESSSVLRKFSMPPPADREGSALVRPAMSQARRVIISRSVASACSAVAADSNAIES